MGISRLPRVILQEFGNHQTGVDIRIRCGREQPGLMPARPRVRVGVDGQKPRLGAVCAVHGDVIDIDGGRLDDEVAIASVVRCPEVERSHGRRREPMIVPVLVLLVLGLHVFVLIAGEEQHRDWPMGGARGVGHRTLDVRVHRGDLRPIAGDAQREHAAGREARDRDARRVDGEYALQRVDERGDEPDVVDVLFLRRATARPGVPRQAEPAESPRAVRRREDESVLVGHGVHLRLPDDVGAVVVVPVQQDHERISALGREVAREVKVEAAIQVPHAERVARGLGRSSGGEWMVRLERCAGGARNEEQDARARRTGRHLQTSPRANLRSQAQ